MMRTSAALNFLTATAILVGSVAICHAHAECSESFDFLRLETGNPFRVIGHPQERAHLFDRPSDCSSSSFRTCLKEQRGYLIPGDVVIAGPVCNGFRPMVYSDGTAAITDYLEASRTEPVPSPSLDEDFLVGDWSNDYNAKVHISRSNGKLVAAAHVENGDYEGDFEGIVRIEHEGSVAFLAEKEDDKAPADQQEPDGCGVTMYRRGPYLVLYATPLCTGADATFTGTGAYVKQTAGKK